MTTSYNNHDHNEGLVKFANEETRETAIRHLSFSLSMCLTGRDYAEMLLMLSSTYLQIDIHSMKYIKRDRIVIMKAMHKLHIRLSIYIKTGLYSIA